MSQIQYLKVQCWPFGPTDSTPTDSADHGEELFGKRVVLNAYRLFLFPKQCSASTAYVAFTTGGLSDLETADRAQVHGGCAQVLCLDLSVPGFWGVCMWRGTGARPLRGRGRPAGVVRWQETPSPSPPSTWGTGFVSGALHCFSCMGCGFGGTQLLGNFTCLHVPHFRAHELLILHSAGAARSPSELREESESTS